MKTPASIFLFSFFLLASHASQCNNVRNEKFYLAVNEVIGGADVQYSYILFDNEFYIYSTSATRKEKEKTRLVYSKKIDSKDFSLIKQRSKMLFKIENRYTKAELDGVRWDISLFFKKRFKSITVENVSVPVIDSVFSAVNEMAPKKYRIDL